MSEPIGIGRGSGGGPLVADDPPLFCVECRHELAWDFTSHQWVRAKDGSTCGWAANGGCSPRQEADHAT